MTTLAINETFRPFELYSVAALSFLLSRHDHGLDDYPASDRTPVFSRRPTISIRVFPNPALSKATANTMTKAANVILYGVGALGSLVMKVLRSDYPTIRIVGAIDTDPAKVGRRLDDLFPANAGIAGIAVTASLSDCLATVSGKVDVALHMTRI